MLAEIPEAGRSDVPLLPAVERAELLAMVVPAMDRDPAFAREPTWDGAPRETGPLARTCRHSLVAPLVARDGYTAAARMAARLVDLALLLGRLAGTSRPKDAPGLVTALPLGRHEGLAAVQTARGLLVHRVRLDHGRVADYAIVAPTEWNFHPRGALARGLAGMTADSEDALRRRAQVAVQALDPCVGCRIEIGDA
jgi:coenzyme F420-reducing hydrogenase alpha subunit